MKVGILGTGAVGQAPGAGFAPFAIEDARLLEQMRGLWVAYGVRSGSWNHAFKLLRK